MQFCCLTYKEHVVIFYIHVWVKNLQFSDEDGDSKKFFYRTAKTRELDNLLGDIYHKILGKYYIDNLLGDMKS